jgi:hypothetical protein
MSIRFIIHKFKIDKWNLAFVEDSLETIIAKRSINVHYMKGNKHSQWFADPFILDVTTDSIVCVVEEFSYKTMKGRIAKLTIDRNTYKLQTIKILLELPTHLSFPFIFRKDGHIYILPENSASGQSTLYEYNPIDDSLTPHSLLCNRPLTDATIFTSGRNSYLLTTQKPNSNGNVLDVYNFDPHSFTIEKDHAQSVMFDNNCARNAGEVFSACGRMFRPAQDCNGGYGKGIILQELRITEDGLSLNDYCSFYPNSKVYNMGYHTFNHYKGVTVVDAHGYRFFVLGRFLTLFSRLYKSIVP